MMPGLVSRAHAGSPEAVARRRFGLWSLVVFVLLLPPWWLWGADILLAMLRPLAAVALQAVGLTGQITTGPDGAWVVGTPLTQGGQPVTYTVPHTALRRLVLGFPLAIAFLTAPPRTLQPIRAVVVSLVVLTMVFLASLAALIWGDLAAQLNPELATTRHDSLASLDQPPLHPVLSQVAIVGRYVGMSIAPLIAAILLWAALNPRGRALVMDDTTLKAQDEA